MYENCNPYELIALNTRIGDMFILGMKGDPMIYKGIPVLPIDLVSNEKPMFEFKIIEPSNLQGLKRWPIDKIELLEKVDAH